MIQCIREFAYGTVRPRAKGPLPHEVVPVGPRSMGAPVGDAHGSLKMHAAL
jgi:hypothetical protein